MVTRSLNCSVLSLSFCSPFPPIASGPYPPVYEFLTKNWKAHGGYLHDHVAIIDGTTGLQRTFHEHHVLATGLAATLEEMGCDMNTTIAMYCPNHVDYLPVILGISLAGSKVTPVNPLYTKDELLTVGFLTVVRLIVECVLTQTFVCCVQVLDRSRSSVLITHTVTLESALAAAKDATHVKHVIVINDNGHAVPEGTIDLHSVRHHKHPITKSPPYTHKHTASHPFSLPYSSGTTGLPKGVCLTHANIVSNLLQCDEVEGLGFAPDHKLISPLPFFHIYAFTVSLLYPAWKGNTVITNSGPFDFVRFCELVEQHKPQRAHLVPPILLGLAKHPIVDKYDVSSLQMIISAAAPLSVETEVAVQERLGCQVKQAWGMSELSPIGTLNSDFNIKRGSVGPLVSSTVAKIVDEQGKSLGPNEPGELLLKGPQVMLGYQDDPEKTAECLSPSGWLRTGDLAYYDEDGYFYISDRIKELIKVRGFPVAPAELEALIHTHPAVQDVAVVQKADDRSGELPRAYIVLKPVENPPTEEELYNWVKERVAPYKRLDGGIVLTDTIPKSASGKILRRLLRDEAK